MTTRQALLLLRWSWRDVRHRWPQVAAIALVIALGTGSYAGLSSLTEWRRASTNDGYASLAMYDLRISLGEGASLPHGELTRLLSGSPGSPVDRITERLVVETQVDASVPGTPILVPGRIYGLELGPDGPLVNQLYPRAGRNLTDADAGSAVAVLEANFAEYHSLPPEGTVLVSGGGELAYVGHVLTPEFFIVTTERGGLLAEASFAAVFMPLATAQQLTGRGDVVNDAVLTLKSGSDIDVARLWLADLLAREHPSAGANIGVRDDDPSFRLNDRDIEGDQQLYEIFAYLIFGGAMIAAFNLIARLVESQRREIGVAMALGAGPGRIALRPLLAGAEIALLGVALGIVVGALLGYAIAGAVQSLMPLPRWETSFRFDVFALVGVIGFALPFLAAAWPVWRAVSVRPIEAMRPAYRAVHVRGSLPIGRIRLPGTTFAQIPVRNVLRSPRRSGLTVIGIAAAIAALIAFVGMIDSFVETIDRGQFEIEGDTPDRLEVTLDRPYALDAPVIATIADASSVGDSEPFLRVAGEAVGGDQEFDLQIDVLPLDSDLWVPNLSDLAAAPGIYVSERAARDLGVGIGDRIELRHPQFGPGGEVSIAQSPVVVRGLHAHPFRFIAYIDAAFAADLGLAGIANGVMVEPALQARPDDVKQELFEVNGVGSIQGVSEVAEALKDLLNEFVIVLRIVEGSLLLLALLIAFNLASINIDERAREHATMFAFGVPVATVMRMSIIENLILGTIATALGVLSGWWLLGAILRTRVRDTFPDLAVPAHIDPLTLGVAVGLGVLAVALAPLLTVRRLRRMNVPGALKVYE